MKLTKENFIRTTEGWVVIDREAEIKGKGYRLDLNHNSVGIIDNQDYYNDRKDEFAKIIATCGFSLDGVVEILRKDQFGFDSVNDYISPENSPEKIDGFIDGYKKAKEKYQYTMEDMFNAITNALHVWQNRAGKLTMRRVALEAIGSINLPSEIELSKAINGKLYIN